MKPRIKELAVQARNYALNEKRIGERTHNLEQPMEEYRDVYNEKFAELIIAECHEVIVVGGVDDLDGVMKHFEIE